PIVLQALRLSFETTCAAALLTVLGGTPIAALLTRDFRGRDALASLMTLPLVLPPVVAGLGLLLAFGRAGLLGHSLSAFGIQRPIRTVGGELSAFGIHVPFSTAAVMLAQTFVAAPLYINAARSAFARADSELLDAA